MRFPRHRVLWGQRAGGRMAETPPPSPATPGTTATATPPAAPPAAPPASPATPPARTFTQDEVNALIHTRAVEEIQRQFGMKPEDVKAALERLAAEEKKNQTETERAVDAARKEAIKAKDEEWGTRLAAERERATGILIRSEVVTEAAKLGFHNPSDAWLYVEEQADKTGADATKKLRVGTDGKVAGVGEVLKKLAEERPYLLAANGPAGTPPGTNRTTNGVVNLTQAQRDAQEMAYTGRIGRRR